MEKFQNKNNCLKNETKFSRSSSGRAYELWDFWPGLPILA
jgi:hypothetical protein